MEIIPAIDIIDGKCVRLTQGDFTQKKIYNENPVEVARQFEEAGIRRLHLVDLDGAKAGTVVNFHVLEAIARNTSLEIDFGGGIKAEKDLRAVFDAGARYATIGSLAVRDAALFESWLNGFGTDRFLLGADVRDEKITIGGWLEDTAIPVYEFLSSWLSKGVTQVFCTDISKDGKLEGASLGLYEQIIEHFPSLYFIASGGVGTMDDLNELKSIGCRAAIVGKAIYEGRISLSELSKFN